MRHKMVCPRDERNALFAPVIQAAKGAFVFWGEGGSHAEP